MNAQILNIRSVNTQKVFTRLISLQRRYKFYFLGLTEPFQKSQELEVYRRSLGFKHVMVNRNGKT